jgi:hypothetical protein
MSPVPNPARIADPRCAELEAMLRRLPPRQELAYRRALFGLSPHCRADGEWHRRIDALSARLKLDTDGLASIMRDAAVLADALLADAAAGVA